MLICCSVLASACGNRAKGGQRVMPVIGAIERAVEETGTIAYDDIYSIASTVDAKVVAADFEEGDIVQKGQVLYELDSKELRNQISQTKISLDKAKEAYRQNVNAANDLTVKSFASGMITKVHCNAGDYVSPGSPIAEVADSKNLILKVPFSLAEKTDIYVGQAADVILGNDGSKVSGSVTRISDLPVPLGGRQSGYNVEIGMVNPGALKKGDSAFAQVGIYASAGYGTIENKTEQLISASQAGQIKGLKVREGDRVTDGAQVAQIKNDTLQNAVNLSAINIKEIENSLSILSDALSDYVILAPIDGQVMQKNAKETDIASGGQPLATVADNITLYANAEIDEIYINDIEPKQRAIVSVHSGGLEYKGEVAKINENGVTKNGVTYYTVKIRLDSFEGLMKGMNVDIKIITAYKDNVLIIPKGAIKGNKVKAVQKKKLVEKEVETGIESKQYTEVISGLTIEDMIFLGDDEK